MKVLQFDVMSRYSRKSHVWCFLVEIHVELVDSILSHLECKGPEHGSYALWPITLRMHQQCALNQGELLCSILRDAILMVRSDSTKSYSLHAPLDIQYEGFFSKSFIISIIVLGFYPTSSGKVFKFVLCFKSYVP